jgi:threonine dehydratase
VRVPIPEIVEDLKSLVDDVWVVDEPAILSGIKSLMELEQVMVEPSAAITIAGLTSNRRALSGKRVAAVITGAHLGLDLIPKALASDSLL